MQGVFSPLSLLFSANIFNHAGAMIEGTAEVTGFTLLQD
jgi:hypothetical protein